MSLESVKLASEDLDRHVSELAVVSTKNEMEKSPPTTSLTNLFNMSDRTASIVLLFICYITLLLIVNALFAPSSPYYDLIAEVVKLKLGKEKYIKEHVDFLHGQYNKMKSVWEDRLRSYNHSDFELKDKAEKLISIIQSDLVKMCHFNSYKIFTVRLLLDLKNELFKLASRRVLKLIQMIDTRMDRAVYMSKTLVDMTKDFDKDWTEEAKNIGPTVDMF